MNQKWYELISSNIKSTLLYIFPFSYYNSLKLLSTFCRTLYYRSWIMMAYLQRIPFPTPWQTVNKWPRPQRQKVWPAEAQMNTITYRLLRLPSWNIFIKLFLWNCKVQTWFKRTNRRSAESRPKSGPCLIYSISFNILYF